MELTAIAGILETVISDVPTLITVVEKIVTIFKEGRVPTDAEWASLNAAADAAHAKLQAD